jgi:hypothetical protein
VAGGSFATCVVDQDPPHAFGGSRKKMRAIGPAGLLIAAQAQPNLVDQRGGLESLVLRFTRHFRGGQPAKFVVDERQQLFRRLRISLVDALENHCDLAVLHSPQRTGS